LDSSIKGSKVSKWLPSAQLEYFLKRFVLFRKIFKSKESDRIIYRTARTMYEYGYDDAINSMIHLIVEHGEWAAATLILAARNREPQDPILPEDERSHRHWGDQWVFDRDFDKRSLESLSSLGGGKELTATVSERSISDLNQWLSAGNWSLRFDESGHPSDPH